MRNELCHAQLSEGRHQTPVLEMLALPKGHLCGLGSEKLSLVCHLLMGLLGQAGCCPRKGHGLVSSSHILIQQVLTSEWCPEKVMHLELQLLRAGESTEPRSLRSIWMT
jgi:hypothetical protein